MARREQVTLSCESLVGGHGKDNEKREVVRMMKKMTVKELQDELRLMNLSTKGKKPELYDRLRTAVENINKEGIEDEAEANTMETRMLKEAVMKESDRKTRYCQKNNVEMPQRRREGQVSGNEAGYVTPSPPRRVMNQQQRQRRNQQRRTDNAERREKTDVEELSEDRDDLVARASRYESRRHMVNYNLLLSNNYRDVPGEREERRLVSNPTSTFTINDVERSIPFFTGDDKTPIRRWINEFEDTSTLLGWKDLQMVIYGKKMLRGSAEQFIALEQSLTSWAEFKHRMIREFIIEVNSATIHAQLVKRKRQANETARQYVYAMQTIANQGYIEEDALIQYIRDGNPR